MNNSAKLKLLFIVNPGSGNNKTNWPEEIERHFKSLQHSIEVFVLPNPCEPLILKQKIDDYQPHVAVAVGGDGTVKLVAECLLQTNITLGILPAGSANGMAKELDIPTDAQEALHVLLNGQIKKISVVRINKELCIHLSDLGFNAFVIKKFDSQKGRGMWGYLKAFWKVLWQQPQMNLVIQADKENVQRQATMIVIANATRYGSGAVINPEGTLHDTLFEVIIVKRISFAEIFKMMVTHKPYDPEKIEILHTRALEIETPKPAHFQVDGEYLGKVSQVKAVLLPQAISVVTPQTTASQHGIEMALRI